MEVAELQARTPPTPESENLPLPQRGTITVLGEDAPRPLQRLPSTLSSSSLLMTSRWDILESCSQRGLCGDGTFRVCTVHYSSH